MKVKQALAALFGMCMIGGSMAQSYELPVYFGQYFNDPQLNSILLDETQTLAATLGHRRNGGDFSGVNTSVVGVQFKLGGNHQDGFNGIGLQIVSDQEGFLIRRNRYTASYSRHLRITEDYFLAAQARAGAYNFIIKSNDVTGGFSSYAFDGAFSLKWYGQGTEVTLGLNQATNSAITPVSNEITLARHLNLLAQHRFDLADPVAVTPLLASRFTPNAPAGYPELAVTGGFRVLLQDKFMTGLTYETQNGTHIYLGLDNLEWQTSRFGIDFAYFLPNGNQFAGNVRRFEVFLNYGLKNEKR